MRRPLCTLVAAAMAVGSTVAGITPVEAAGVRIAPPVGVEAAADGAVVKVRDYDRRWRSHNRHRRSSHRRHHHVPFFFGLPFAFVPYYYNSYPRDCFRGRDGRIYCPRYY
jgi:hypothetical protein